MTAAEVYLYWPETNAICLETSVAVPEFTQDVIHIIQALSVVPPERTDVLRACPFFSKLMRSNVIKKEVSVKERFGPGSGYPLHHPP